MLARQLEVRPLVVELGHRRERSVRALVLVMTAAAVATVGDARVHGAFFIELSADIGVAIEAARGHGFAAPGRRVTGAAVARDLGVRGYAAEFPLAAMLLAERAGGEHFAAAGG